MSKKIRKILKIKINGILIITLGHRDCSGLNFVALRHKMLFLHTMLQLVLVELQYHMVLLVESMRDYLVH